jgi:hypothetical protein
MERRNQWRLHNCSTNSPKWELRQQCPKDLFRTDKLSGILLTCHIKSFGLHLGR